MSGASVAVDVSIMADGVKKPISFDTPVLVGITYELGEKEDVGNLKVYYVADDGTIEEMSGAHYADGKVYFKTTHFSCYAAVFEPFEVDGTIS